MNTPRLAGQLTSCRLKGVLPAADPCPENCTALTPGRVTTLSTEPGSTLQVGTWIRIVALMLNVSTGRGATVPFLQPLFHDQLPSQMSIFHCESCPVRGLL